MADVHPAVIAYAIDVLLVELACRVPIRVVRRVDLRRITFDTARYHEPSSAAHPPHGLKRNSTSARPNRIVSNAASRYRFSGVQR